MGETAARATGEELVEQDIDVAVALVASALG
jgi:hypothetical protein